MASRRLSDDIVALRREAESALRAADAEKASLAASNEANARRISVLESMKEIYCDPSAASAMEQISLGKSINLKSPDNRKAETEVIALDRANEGSKAARRIPSMDGVMKDILNDPCVAEALNQLSQKPSTLQPPSTSQQTSKSKPKQATTSTKKHPCAASGGSMHDSLRSLRTDTTCAPTPHCSSTTDILHESNTSLRSFLESRRSSVRSNAALNESNASLRISDCVIENPGDDGHGRGARRKRRPSIDSIADLFGISRMVDAACEADEGADDVDEDAEAQRLIEQLQSEIEGADSTSQMMGYVLETQKRELASLRVEAAQRKARRRCNEVRAICARAEPLRSADDGASLSERRRADAAARVTALQERLRGASSDVDVRSAEDAEVEARSLSCWIREAQARLRVSEARASLVANRLMGRIESAQNEKRTLKIKAKVKKRNSVRAVGKLCESMDDAQSVETKSDVVMVRVKVLRQSVLKKMTVSLEDDIDAIRELEQMAEVRPRMLAASQEAGHQLDDMLTWMKGLADRWERERLLRETAKEQEQTIKGLERDLRGDDTEAALRQELESIRMQAWKKLQTSLATIKASQRKVMQLRELASLQEARYQNLLERYASCPGGKEPVAKDTETGAIHTVWEGLSDGILQGAHFSPHILLK